MPNDTTVLTTTRHLPHVDPVKPQEELLLQNSLPHVLGIEDIAGSIPAILKTALAWKARAAQGPLPQHLAGTVCALVFQNPSTRTRASLEAGIVRLGGGCTTLETHTSQMGRGESIEDTVGALSRYVDLVVVRAKSHADLESFARHSKVPVVNALTDKQHPLQTLADLMTIAEAYASGPRPGLDPTLNLDGRTLSWIGDGDNVCNSLILGALSCGMHVKVATPESHKPPADILARAERIAEANDRTFLTTDNPLEAAVGAHVVSTDTWCSMGTEEERAERLVVFQGYTVDNGLMGTADPGAVFLHCMPGHWGEEATYTVAHGAQSRMFDQAENRMWSQMALLVEILKKASRS